MESKLTLFLKHLFWKTARMSSIRKIISGRQVNLTRQVLRNKFRLSRDNVDFIKTPDGRPEGDQISTFHRIRGGRGIENLERMHLRDINPGYTWRGGIMRCLEAGTYIFYGSHPSDIDQVYIPSGKLCTTLYYDNQHESFFLEQGDFILHPVPGCTMLMVQEDMDLFVLEYSSFQSEPSAEGESPDESDLKINVSMAMKHYNFVKLTGEPVWSLVRL